MDEENPRLDRCLPGAADAAESSSNDAEGGARGGATREISTPSSSTVGAARRTYLVAQMNRREAEDIALTDAGLRFGSRVRLIPAARDIPYGGGGGGAGGFARGARGERRGDVLERRARRLNFSSRATTVASSAARGTAPPSPQVVRPA